MPKGIEVIDFGTFPGSHEASVVVTGQTAILSTSDAEAFFMSETSADYTAKDHRYIGLFARLTCGDIVAGTGFTIFGISTEKLTGRFSIRWVWV